MPQRNADESPRQTPDQRRIVELEARVANREAQLIALQRDAEREMAMARALIANLERQCEQSARRAAESHAELEEERRRSARLRRQFARISAVSGPPSQRRPVALRLDVPQSDKPTVQLRAVC